MKYILMCGGDYSDQFEIPKPLLKITGEVLIERTIRLLKENGIKDIAISTTNHLYDYLGIEILRHENHYIHESKDLPKKSENAWLNAYYPTDEPACYLPGDIYWSEEAIKTIINTEVKDTMFFAAPAVYDGRKNQNIKSHREPLGFKVQNQTVFRQAINDLLDMIDKGKFGVDPVSWTLYKRLNGLQINFNSWNNDIFDKPGNLVVIDDITTDIDSKKDIPKLEKLIYFKKCIKGGNFMVRVKAKEFFTINETMFKQLKEIVRAFIENNEPNTIYKDDIFLCSNKIAGYLLNELDKEGNKGTNPANRALVEVIEVIPDEVTKEEPKAVEQVKETKPRKRATKKADKK